MKTGAGVSSSVRTLYALGAMGCGVIFCYAIVPRLFRVHTASFSAVVAVTLTIVLPALMTRLLSQPGGLNFIQLFIRLMPVIGWMILLASTRALGMETVDTLFWHASADIVGVPLLVRAWWPPNHETVRRRILQFGYLLIAFVAIGHIIMYHASLSILPISYLAILALASLLSVASRV